MTAKSHEAGAAMAKNTTASAVPARPEVAPRQGIELLNRQISMGEALRAKRPISENDYSAWELVTENYLVKAFGRESPNVASVTDVGKYGSFPMGAPPAFWEDHRAESLETQLSKLRVLTELLDTESRLQNDGVAKEPTAAGGNQIFLVHGHDELALHETARFLERLGQRVRVLREQPNRGRTIIEKFEDFADVGFAVILLTGDDRGGTKETAFDAQRPRARQNVIFEMGYFIGRLGRDRVCVLYGPGVEIPSDYSGVLYQEIDEKGAWRWELAKELKAANFEVDMNRAL
jgi:predicted nucleotide-binding protein